LTLQRNTRQNLREEGAEKNFEVKGEKPFSTSKEAPPQSPGGHYQGREDHHTPATKDEQLDSFTVA